MYILNGITLGQTATPAVPASPTSPATVPAPASPKATATTNYTKNVTDLISLANTKDWTNLNIGINALIGDPNLAINAGTLVAPLTALQNQVQSMIAGAGPDLSGSIQTSINNLISQAKIEASADPNDLLMNQELLRQRLFDLSNELNNFASSNSGFKVLWNRISGQDVTLFAPLKADLADIANDIHITPLTPSDRASILSQYQSQQQSADSLWAADQNTIRTVGYALLITAGTAGITALGTYVGGLATAHATKHAKRLHKYITGGDEASKKRRRKRRK